MTPERVVAIGVGNVHRADDGVGPAALDELRRLLPAEQGGPRIRVCPGDMAGLIGLWEGASLAVVIDACLTDPGQEGAITRTVLAPEQTLITAPGSLHSTHGLGLGEALELARLLGRRPARLLLYTVGVADVGRRSGLSPQVAAVVPEIAARVVGDVQDACEHHV